MSAKLRRTGLGKGLGALLEDTPEKDVVLQPQGISSHPIGEIPISQIKVNPFQPRTEFNEESLQELAESIKVQGIIQPITVRKVAESEYQLISGERRLQASKMAELDAIPAYVRTADDQQMLEMALIENIQRENLNAIEIALSYQRLISECNLKQDQLGERVGKNRTTVNNYLRLLRLPPDIQIAVRDGEISMGHARALISMENADVQLDVFKKIVKEGLSVRKTEELVRKLSLPQEPVEKKVKEEPDPEMVRLNDQLSSHFGTKIRIKQGKDNKGEIAIPYQSTEDLNRILEILDI